MTRRFFWLVVAVALVVTGAVLNNQVRVWRGRRSRAAENAKRDPSRQRVFNLLRPVALSNCRLERFGEAHDGGYLMCANLLDKVEAGYSYGISGYDKWGCD